MLTENNAIIIELARSNDYRSICVLLEAYNLPYEDIRIEYLKHFFVARKENHIIGIVGLEIFNQLALLRSLAVHNNFRGLGLGSKLVNHLEMYAVCRNVKEIYLLTTTAESFFINLGYSTIDRDMAPEVIKSTLEFQSLCPTSAIPMVKNIHDDRSH